MMSKTRVIKLNRGVAGDVYTYAAGQIVKDCPEDRAADLVQAGHAVYLDASPHSRAETPESKKRIQKR